MPAQPASPSGTVLAAVASEVVATVGQGKKKMLVTRTDDGNSLEFIKDLGLSNHWPLMSSLVVMMITKPIQLARLLLLN